MRLDWAPMKAKWRPVGRVLLDYTLTVMRRFCFKRKLFDRGSRRETAVVWTFLIEALRTHLCYGTRQILQGQRIKAREKNKNRNKNWRRTGRKRRKGQRKWEKLEEHSGYVSNSRDRNRGSVYRDTGNHTSEYYTLKHLILIFFFTLSFHKSGFIYIIWHEIVHSISSTHSKFSLTSIPQAETSPTEAACKLIDLVAYHGEFNFYIQAATEGHPTSSIPFPPGL